MGNVIYIPANVAEVELGHLPGCVTREAQNQTSGKNSYQRSDKDAGRSPARNPGARASLSIEPGHFRNALLCFDLVALGGFRIEAAVQRLINLAHCSVRSFGTQILPPQKRALRGSGLLYVHLCHLHGRHRAILICSAGVRGRGYLVDNIHSFSHAAEDGVVRLKGVGLMHYEELARTGFRYALVCHSHEPAPIAALIQRGASIDFVWKRLGCRSLASRSLAIRISSLDHEAADHPMKDCAVVETALGELAEILRRLWRFIFEQLELDGAGIGFNDRGPVRLILFSCRF